MGEHKIGQIMKEMGGVPRDKLIDITGHRTVLNLNSYEGDDENQAKNSKT